MKAVVVKTAQMWRGSKKASHMLCFERETATGGRKGGDIGQAVAGYGGPREAMAGEFRFRGKESNVRHFVGECHCRLQDVL